MLRIVLQRKTEQLQCCMVCTVLSQRGGPHLRLADAALLDAQVAGAVPVRAVLLVLEGDGRPEVVVLARAAEAALLAGRIVLGHGRRRRRARRHRQLHGAQLPGCSLHMRSTM
jgi:hypothetical protein